MVQESLEHHSRLITDISINGTAGIISVNRVNPLYNTTHPFEHPVLDFNELVSTSINFIENKPVDSSVADITSYTALGTDRVIYDELTGITYIHKDGQRYILKDNPIDNAYIRVPAYKAGRLYRGMTVVRFTNERMYMSTKSTITTPLSGGSDWVEVSEFDLFITRCELDAEELSGSLVVDFLSDLVDGANVVSHYTLSNNNLGDLLENNIVALAHPASKSVVFSGDTSRIIISPTNAGISIPSSLGVAALISGSFRFEVDQLPVSDESLITVSQSNTVDENWFQIYLSTTTGTITVAYRTIEGGAVTIVSSNTNVVTGTEYSLAYTINGADIKVYLNGSTLILEHTAGASLANTPLGVFVGVNEVGGSSYTGTLRDIRFYDSPLTSLEIQEVYDYGN